MLVSHRPPTAHVSSRLNTPTHVIKLVCVFIVTATRYLTIMQTDNYNKWFNYNIYNKYARLYFKHILFHISWNGVGPQVRPTLDSALPYNDMVTWYLNGLFPFRLLPFRLLPFRLLFLHIVPISSTQEIASIPVSSTVQIVCL